MSPEELRRLCGDFVEEVREYVRHEPSGYQMGPDPDPARKLYILLARVADEGVA